MRVSGGMRVPGAERDVNLIPLGEKGRSVRFGCGRTSNESTLDRAVGMAAGAAVRRLPTVALTVMAETPLCGPGAGAAKLRDALGRPLQDLRVSVTDRCNFRCPYCMPREQFEGHRFLPAADQLGFAEIER